MFLSHCKFFFFGSINGSCVNLNNMHMEKTESSSQLWPFMLPGTWPNLIDSKIIVVYLTIRKNSSLLGPISMLVNVGFQRVNLKPKHFNYLPLLFIGGLLFCIHWEEILIRIKREKGILLSLHSTRSKVHTKEIKKKQTI